MAATSRGTYVKALYDYERRYPNGSKVAIKAGEVFLLLKKTNEEWWSVVRMNEKKSMHVPANYVEIIQKDAAQKSKTLPPKPPKPPLKPKNFLKPSEEQSILDSLDAILDSAETFSLDDEVPVENSPEADVDQTAKPFPKENGSEKSSSVGNSTERLAQEQQADQSHIQNSVDTFSDIMRKKESTNSLDRKRSTRPPTEVGHRKSASASVTLAPDRLSNGDVRLRDKITSKVGDVADVKKSPALSKKPSVYYEEEPNYVNVPTNQEEEEEPEYANIDAIQEHLPSWPPPKPTADEKPVFKLDADWSMYSDPSSRRKYYFNSNTGESSWKMPRDTGSSISPRDLGQPTSSLRPASRTNSFGTPCTLEVPGLSPTYETVDEPWLPVGWSEKKMDSGDTFFVNELTNEKWMSSVDETGRVYYYKEGTSESAWELPQSPTLVQEDEEENSEAFQAAGVSPGGATAAAHNAPLAENLLAITNPIPASLRLREMRGMLNKTKVMENGKKVKKSWGPTYVVTTGPMLYFYKDQKMAQPKPQLPTGRPESVVELYGASVEFAKDSISSKKNIVQITTSGESQFLLQSDDKNAIYEWCTILKGNLAIMAQAQGTKDGVNENIPSPSTENAAEDDSNQSTANRAQRMRKQPRRSDRPSTPDDTLGDDRNSKVKDWLRYWIT